MTTLFVLGNLNEHTFANAIVAANMISKKEFGNPLREIYVLHTSESYKQLTTSGAWLDHLHVHNIDSDIITHRTIEILPGASATSAAGIGRFAKYVETAVRASEPGQIIVDLTNGTSMHKNLLSTVAYILDIPHLYAIDIAQFKKAPKELGFLDEAQLQSAYVQLPESTILDSIAHLSVTEVVRYQRMVDSHTSQYNEINPLASDEEFFSGNLLHSIRMKLQGDRSPQRDNALYRIASSSVGASIEDLVRVLMTKLPSRDTTETDRATLGQRLGVLSQYVKSNHQADFDFEFFRRFNEFMLYLRNSTTHKGKFLTDVERIKADLALKMSFPFLKFYAEIVHPILDNATIAAHEPVRIQTLNNAEIAQHDIYFVGIDGDNTGAALEELFLSATDEKQFRELSHGIQKAVDAISDRIKNRHPKKDKPIIFAAGDDILFQGRIDEGFLTELQDLYKASSQGQTCSIGYGKSFREAYVALKLAKSKPGKNAIVGVEIQ